mmetsp:Transcript_64601/g.185748  ORF Transcript_64601/g.185748 Transcript_64601/m.185748 type:complete len:239 (+) Transcript_64601:442-1158(+)
MVHVPERGAVQCRRPLGRLRQGLREPRLRGRPAWRLREGRGQRPPRDDRDMRACARRATRRRLHAAARADYTIDIVDVVDTVDITDVVVDIAVVVDIGVDIVVGIDVDIFDIFDILDGPAVVDKGLLPLGASGRRVGRHVHMPQRRDIPRRRPPGRVREGLGELGLRGRHPERVPPERGPGPSRNDGDMCPGGGVRAAGDQRAASQRPARAQDDQRTAGGRGGVDDLRANADGDDRIT